MGSQMWEGQHVLPELKENLEELFPGLTLEEALQHQDCLLQSLKISCGYRTARSSDSGPSRRHGHSAGISSFSESVDYQLAVDEAVARSLQDMEDVEVHIHVPISEPLPTTSRNTERAAVGTSDTNAHQDNIDPDNMSYEERLALEEASGVVKQGLTESQIASLPSYVLKSGGGFFSSKKVNLGECVICFNAYKNKDFVISLPCAHQYHKDCIEPWLKNKKICPLCKKEVVFD